MRRLAALAFCALFLTPSAAKAQVVLLREGSTLRAQVAPNGKIAVPVVVDLSNGAGTNVSALTLSLNWATSRLTFDSVKTGGFGSLTSNTSGASTGSLALSMFDASGTTSTFTMATVYFTASATPGGARVTMNPTVAGNDVGTSILSLFRLQDLDVCVATSGLYGDSNGDANVNIIDAQQIARFSVGLSVANSTALNANGDVTADGNINIIDAQQIARYSVSLSAAARVNTTYFTAAALNALAMSQGTGTVSIGGTLQLTALLTDASNNSLAGCYPVTWSSLQPTFASVDSTGRVVGNNTGSATITAGAGGKSATATITIGNVSGPPASIAMAQGDQQWSYASNSVPVLPQVLVKDASQNPVPNVAVTFTASAGTFNGGAPLIVNTDANGLASASNWVAPATGATAIMTASIAGGLSATATANILAAASAQTTCIYDGWSSRCWGVGTRGQLGNGANTSSASPGAVSVGATGMKVATKTAWGDHFCGLNSSGAAYCWGWNTAGQLGDGTRTDRNVPTLVSGSLTFRSLATGSQHTCGVTLAGEVYCWGVSTLGQLGDGSLGAQRLVPTKANTPAGIVFTQVATGNNHTCAATAAGDVYCWGVNNNGQLGDGTISTTPRPTPALITGGLKYPIISASPSGTCGLTSAGAAYCWGGNGSGQLGNGTFVNSATPVAVQGGLVFSNITSGNGRACGERGSLGEEYTVWCWGFNGGALGDGTSVNRPSPTLIGPSMQQLFHGGTSSPNYACGVQPGGGQIFCWGANASGQLGFGSTSTTAQSSPDLVARAGATAGAPSAMGPGDSGQSQSAAASTALPVAPIVLVGDGLGNLLPNVTVTWTVLSGGGSVTNPTSQTGADGTATSGGWTLGPTLGMQKMQATVSGIIVNGSPAPPLRQTFIAYATNAPALAVKISGDSAWNSTNTQANNHIIPMVVKVTDGSSNPIANVTVTFALGANSGSLGASSEATILTDAAGLATLPANEWIPTTSGTSTLTATVAGIATPLVFTHFTATTSASFGLASCELTNAGAAMCAGLNANGTVGDGTNTNRSTFVPVSGGLVFTSLAEGVGSHKCALVGTTAYCWGYNGLGQLGDGSFVDRNVPTAVLGGLAFSKLYTQGMTTCGLTTSSLLYCWGWSGTAGWGIGEAQRGRRFNVPTLVNTEGNTFTKIAVMDDAVCGLTGAGAIKCRGRALANGDGTSDQRVTFSTWSGGPWSDVSTGNNSMCSLDITGLAFCLGSDQGGALGIGTGGVGSRTVPTQTLGGTTFASIHVQNFRACARRANGELWCWGLNNGTGTSAVVDRPTLVPGITVTSVRQETFRNACAKVANGQLYCWGPNVVGSTGVVGDGTGIDRLSPVAVVGWPDGPAAGTAAAIYVGQSAYTGIVGAAVSPLPSVTVKDRLGNAVAGASVTFNAPAGSGTVTGGTVVTNASGVATVGSWTLPSTTGTARLDVTTTGVPQASFVATVSAAPNTITITAGNNQYMPDFSTNAQAASVTVLDASNVPLANVGVTFAVAAGNGTISGGSSIVVATNASGVATANGIWSVPLATGTAYAMTATAPGLPAVTFTARRLAFNNNSPNNPNSTQCRLTVAKAAYCWGGNTTGAVGDGSVTGRNAPVAVSGGLTLDSLARGPFNFHNCGLTSAGQAYCWGANDAGQLGNNSQTNSPVPVAVAGGLTFVSLATGQLSTCGVTFTGAMYCWGWGGYSHRGDGELYTIRLVPTLVNTGGRIFVNISIGTRAICALDVSGQAFCWGENFTGHLGNGNTTSSTVPVATNTALRFKSLTAGFDHTCGLTLSNTVACWGGNYNGQIGNGNLVNQFSPTVVSGLTGVQEVRSGESHVCARTSTSVYCWGYNGGGNVGDGTTTSPRSTPVQVALGITPVSLATFSRGLSCVSTSTQLYCWGSSPFGVGDGTGSSRTAPTAVIWPDAPTSAAATTIPTTPFTITAAAGELQTVLVQVKNAAGTLMPNVTVNFVVTSGGGEVTAGTAITSPSGITSTAWKLAGAVGTVGTLEIRVTGIPTVIITGTVVASAGSISITGGNGQWLPDFFGVGTSPTVTVLDASSAPSAGTTVNWLPLAGTVSNFATNTNASGVATLPSWTTPTAIGTAYTLQASATGLPPVTFTTRRFSWGNNGASNPTSSFCRLNSSGAALCWGGNAQGQVGDGTNTNRTVPTAVSGGLTFTSLAKGGFGLHNCGLTAGGQAYCWGTNEVGQLGNNSQTNSNVPVLVSGGLTFSHLATGGASTCGLSGGAMYCWGWGNWSFRGDGEIYTNRLVPTAVATGGKTFVSIAVGLRVICALDASGQAYCWGENYAGQLGTGNFTYSTTPVATSTSLRFTSLSAGHDQVCGLTTTNTVACWGANGSGTTGNGTTTNQTTPLEVAGITGALEVRGGETFYCARTSTKVYCWGNNGSGQIGDGTFTNKLSPVVAMTGVAASSLLSFSKGASCATASSQMYCWGGGPGGIGDGTGSNRTVPTAIQWPEAPASDVATTSPITPSTITGAAAVAQTVTVQLKGNLGALKAGVGVTFVVTSGGGSVPGGTVTTDANGYASTTWTLAGAIGTVGTLEARVTGVPSLVFTGTVVAGAGSITITGGNNQYNADFATFTLPLSVTVLDGSNAPMVGTTVTWTVTAGNGTIGTTAVNTATGGIATLGSWSPPTAIGTAYTLQASVPGLAPVTFTTRRFAWSNNGASNPTNAMCRLSAGAAYCWGGNTLGAVGDGSFTSRTAPTLVSGGITFASLAKGGWGAHNCGLTAAGQAYCWGSNEMGQLGNNSLANSNVPVLVSGGLAFAHLTTGPVYTCGITTGGATYCWGWGGSSLRGDNELYTIRTVPTLVNTGGRTFVSLAAGLRSLCGLDVSGQAFCWGEGGGGQLGTGTTSSSTTPVATSTALRFTSLTAGFDHTCGHSTTNTVACWGYNGNGVVGNGTTINQTTPFEVAVSGALEVRAGELHNCARTSSSVYCWGINSSGQVGDGTTTGPRTSPVLVASGLTATSLLSFAKNISCAANSTQMYCWGNSSGGVGDGTFTLRSVATAVRWPEAPEFDAAMTVAITPVTISAAAGAPQTVTVQVRTALGVPLVGVNLSFVVTSGGGSSTVTSVQTGAGGNASTSWTLAGGSGTVGKLEARVNGIPTLVITGTVP
ncbi:MAG: Ig-like domain-containing protein [Gemmatimonadota bacterium]